MPLVLQRASGAARGSPPSHWTLAGYAWIPCAVMLVAWRRARPSAQRPFPLSPALGWDSRSGSRTYSDRQGGLTWAAPPPRLARTGARHPFRCFCAEDGTRGQRRVSVAATTLRRLGTRRHRGARTSLRVGCRHVGAPVDGNEDSTRCQGWTALGLQYGGKKWGKSALRESLSLDNGGPHTCWASTGTECGLGTLAWLPPPTTARQTTSTSWGSISLPPPGGAFQGARCAASGMRQPDHCSTPLTFHRALTAA
jgi:hypothetical protein